MSELATLRRWLADHRESVERKTADLDAEVTDADRRSPRPDA